MAEKENRVFYGWYIVAASFITLFMTTGIGFYTFSVFMLPLEQYFGVSRTSVSFFNMIMALVAGFATPAIGVLVHTWGAQKVIGIGAVITGAGYLLLSLASEMSHLYVLAFFIGIGLAATTLVPNQTIISYWFVKKRGRAMGIAMAGIAFGGIFWAPAAHAFISQFRWQGAFAVFGIVIPIAILPLAVFVFRRSPESVGLKPDGDTDAGGNEMPPPPGAGPEAMSLPVLTVGQSVRTASFWYLFLVNFFMILGTSIITGHVVAIVAGSVLGDALGRAEAMRIGSRAITYFLIVSIVGRFSGGFLAERYSKRHVLGIHYLVMIFSAVLLFQLNSMPSLYLFVLLYGIGMGGSAVVYPLILAENFGLPSFSKLLGIMGIPFTLGAAVGVVGAAKIYDVMSASGTGNPYGIVFILLASVFAVSAFLVLLAKPPTATPFPENLPEQEPA